MDEHAHTNTHITGATLHRAIIIGFQAMIAVIPLFYSPLFMEYGAPKLIVAQVMGFALGMLWLASMALDRQIAVVDTPLYYVFLAMLSTHFISLFQAYNVAQGLDQIFRQACFFGLSVMVFHLVQTPGQMRRLSGAMAITGGIVAIIGLLQHNGIYAFHAPWSLPVSTIGNVNFVAQYYNVVFPIALVMLFLVRGIWKRLGVGSACFFMACHIIVLGSRGGWIGTGAALAIAGSIALLRRFHVGRRLFTGIAITAVVAMLSWPLIAGMVSQIPVSQNQTLGSVVDDYWMRITERLSLGIRLADDSTRQRVSLWEDTLRMIFDHPLLGVGAGNFQFNEPKYASRESLEIKRRFEQPAGQDLMAFNAHNEYLEIWAETGLIGLAAFGAFLFLLLRALAGAVLRYIRSNGDPLIIGFAAAVGATLVHSAFDSNLQQPASAVHFWIVVGMVWSLKLNAEGRAPLELLFVEGRKAGVVMMALCGMALIATAGMGARTLMGEYYYLKGRWAFHSQNYKEAEGLWQRASAYGPTKHFRTYQSLGTALYHQGKWGEAADAYRQSLAQFPHNARVHYMLGRSLSNAGDTQAALPHFQTAVSLNPLRVEFHLGLGEALSNAGDAKAAIAALEKAHSMTPDDPEVHHLIGTNHKRLGNMEAALASYQQAIALAPDRPEFLNSLAVAYSETEQFEQARDIFQRLIAQVPDNPDYHFNLAIILVTLEHYTEALAQLQAVIAAAPRYARAYVVMGQLLAMQGHLDEAERAYREALRLQPGDPVIREALQHLVNP